MSLGRTGNHDLADGRRPRAGQVRGSGRTSRTRLDAFVPEVLPYTLRSLSPASELERRSTLLTLSPTRRWPSRKGPLRPAHATSSVTHGHGDDSPLLSMSVVPLCPLFSTEGLFRHVPDPPAKEGHYIVGLTECPLPTFRSQTPQGEHAFSRSVSRHHTTRATGLSNTIWYRQCESNTLAPKGSVLQTELGTVPPSSALVRVVGFEPTSTYSRSR